MSRWLSLLAALGCLVAAGAAFASVPSKPEPKREKPFVARVYTSEPARAPAPKPEPAPEAEPRKKPAKKAKRKMRMNLPPMMLTAPKAPRASSPSASAASAAPSAPASSDSLGADWEPVVRYYSGGDYGVAHINKLASKSGSGGVPGDRQMVAAAASRYGIPFALLWGTYGAESSYGTNTGGGAKPPYFGLTHSYPGPPTSPYRGTSGNFASDAAKSARSWAKNYKLKVGRWPSPQAQSALG